MAKSKKHVSKPQKKTRRKATNKKSRANTPKQSRSRDTKGETKTKKSNAKNSKPVSKNAPRKRAGRTSKDVKRKSVADEKAKVKQTRVQKTSTKKSDSAKSKKKAGTGLSKPVKRSSQKLPKLSVTRKRGENLVKISFDSKSIQKVILAIREYPFNELKSLLYNNKKPFPRVIIMILKIKKPYQKEPFYNTFPIGSEVSISSISVVKDLVCESLADYNNYYAEKIEMEYDANTTVYKILEIALRFLYPSDPVNFKK